MASLEEYYGRIFADENLSSMLNQSNRQTVGFPSILGALTARFDSATYNYEPNLFESTRQMFANLLRKFLDVETALFGNSFNLSSDEQSMSDDTDESE